MAAATERRVDLMRRDRFERARQEVFDRIRHVCTNFGAKELEDLTAQMTRIRLKYEIIGGLSRKN